MSPITPDDRTIASLKTLIANLNRHIVQDTARVAEYSNEAQTAVKNHNRSSALHALRSRKTAENSLSQRLDTLAQVQNVYEKIEQASDQISLISAMKASTGVLRNLNTQIGGIDTAEDILEGLQNEMTKVDDISRTIQEAGQAVDDEAVDEELEDMMRQNRAAEEEKPKHQSEEKVDFVGKTRAHPEVPNWSSTTDPQLNPKPSIKSIENKDFLSQSTDAMKRMSLDDNPSGSGELSQVSKPPSRSPPVPVLES